MRHAQNKKGPPLGEPYVTYKNNPTVMPCVTVPLNLLETGGTRRAAFDFQSRPVGHNRDSDSVSYLLRFKDIVSNHEHRQGKFYFDLHSKEPARWPLRSLSRVLI